MSKENLDEAHFIQEKVFNKSRSLFEKYSDLVIGNTSILKLLKYELITGLLAPIPGALGLLLRKKLYPLLFDRIGKGVIFGKNITLRHPEKIFLGDNVIIDDYAFIDARGSGEAGVCIGSATLIGRHSTILSKVGPISLGKSCTFGSFSVITAQGGVEIKDRVQIAGGCKISGGLFKLHQADGDKINYTRYTTGHIVIKEGCFIGGGTLIMDGVTIGKGSMTGAGSVVIQNIPEFSIYMPRPGLILPQNKAAQK